MTGKHNGFAAYMKKDSPYLIDIHCIAHHLALASSQAAGDIPYLQRYKRLISSIYSYFSHSSNCQTWLKDVETVLDDPRLANFMKSDGLKLLILQSFAKV